MNTRILEYQKKNNINKVKYGNHNYLFSITQVLYIIKDSNSLDFFENKIKTINILQFHFVYMYFHAFFNFIK